MKKFTLVMLVGSLFMVSCKKDDPGSGGGSNNPPKIVNNYTINGDGYNNKKVEFDNPHASEGTFSFSPNNTYLFIAQKIGDDSANISINFSGSGGGDYGFGGMTGISVGFKKPGSNKFYASKSGQGSIKVETWGAVGERIKGTFSGTFFDPFTSATVTVTDGHFDVKRLADK